MVKRGLGAVCVHTAECVTSDGCAMSALSPSMFPAPSFTVSDLP